MVIFQITIPGQCYDPPISVLAGHYEKTVCGIRTESIIAG